MKVEVTEEGVVYCDGMTCLGCMQRSTMCDNCPLRILLDMLS